eukprot:8419132-Pyramimonas_sp.AAC.1
MHLKPDRLRNGWRGQSVRAFTFLSPQIFQSPQSSIFHVFSLRILSPQVFQSPQSSIFQVIRLRVLSPQ